MIDLLDGEVTGEQVAGVMAAIQNDPPRANNGHTCRWQGMPCVMGALADQVAAIKEQYHAGQAGHVTTMKKGIVRKMVFNAMKIAACLLIVIGGLGVLKYTLTAPSDIYNDYYSSMS